MKKRSTPPDKPLLPLLKNIFTPPSRTPWGGKLIAKLPAFKGKQPNKVIGEAWVISGHRSFSGFPGVRLPFLVKLLNSASVKSANLSVQVHPYRGYKKSHPSKTEGWIILKSEKGSGIHMGLKKGVTKKQMRDDLKNGRDITRHLNFVETRPGDVFFIPAGTPHAIGAGQLLLEVQETSETTYRYYDYGRKDSTGKTRKLHIADALNVTNWNAPRGRACVQSLRRRPTPIEKTKKDRAKIYSLVDEKEFSLQKIELKKAGRYINTGKHGIEGFVITEGAVTVISSQGKKTGPLLQGQSFIILAGTSECAIINSTMGKTAVIYKIFVRRPSAQIFDIY